MSNFEGMDREDYPTEEESRLQEIEDATPLKTCKTCNHWRSTAWYCSKHDAPQAEWGEHDCHEPYDPIPTVNSKGKRITDE